MGEVSLKGRKQAIEKASIRMANLTNPLGLEGHIKSVADLANVIDQKSVKGPLNLPGKRPCHPTQAQALMRATFESGLKLCR